MHTLSEDCFPPDIGNLFVSLGRVGFFENSVLIGSWVMPIYQELHGIRYALRTTDIDLAVSVAHPRAKLRADLGRIITDLGFTDFINAQPLPFIDILMEFSEQADLGGTTIRVPIPEAYFLHKLIVSQRRVSEGKRMKDLEQCAILTPVLDDAALQRVVQAHPYSKETRRQVALSCERIGFPLPRLGMPGR